MKKVSSYQKLKVKVAMLQKEKMQLRRDIYILMNGNKVERNYVIVKYRMEDGIEAMVWAGQHEKPKGKVAGLWSSIMKVANAD